MTSFAFILGVLPLALAEGGAGASGQKSLGIAVASGMTVATAMGVFVIPALYVMVQGGAEFFSRKKKTVTPHNSEPIH